MNRRDFLARGAAIGGAALIGARALAAQQAGQQTAQPIAPVAEQQSGSSNLFDMDQGATKSVRLPPKPGASASMSSDQRDALEHQIRCQCGCTLDVYTCRTTDFSCQVSPAMHRDVMALVDGGYSAQEILDAFVQTYGERALMAPKKEGFNWAGYIVPFAALAAGSAALAVVLRKMQARTQPQVVSASGPRLGTDDEMARLDAAIRRDDD
ncbi:MAG TPA: cytochrome c-type biogenesis protein CcmH [Gemmatimonadaceae bacterium]|jgi:cytochrome c-type biogenesis protein CcmH|nr:cytochrome c-type biogenesis protein CcmH [Gemmatimonadaceae bacterium]